MTRDQRVEAPPAQPRRTFWAAAYRLLCAGVSGFLIVSIMLVTLYRDVPPPVTPLMLIRAAQGYGITKDWQSLDEISGQLVRAVMAGEDGKFCGHHGFDWRAIGNAWLRYRAGGRILGASTISMQTAKNVFLWPGRDWLRKAFEAYFTVLIELAWDKRRIMEVYLNIVEWGPGLYGAEAAARHYFHRGAATLSIEEAVRLAAALPDPLDRVPSRPGRAAGHHGAFIRRQMTVVAAVQPLPCGEVLSGAAIAD